MAIHKMTSPDWTALGVIATAVGTIVTSVLSFLTHRQSKNNAGVLQEVKANSNGNLIAQTRETAIAKTALADATGKAEDRVAASDAHAVLRSREAGDAVAKERMHDPTI
jgi:hypothetical protein